MTEQQASEYAEKVAQRLFTCDDGEKANYIARCDSRDFLGSMDWAYVIGQVKAALMEDSK